SGNDEVVRLLEGVLARDLAGPVRGELSLRTALVMDNGPREPRRQRELCLAAVRHLDPARTDLRAWAMVCLGIPTGLPNPLSEHRTGLRRALAEPAATAGPASRIRLLGKAAMVQVLAGDPQWRDLVDQIGALATDHTRDQQAWACYTVAVEACYAGHHDLAESLLAQAVTHTATWERPVRRASLQSARALIDYYRGDWHDLGPQVEQLIDQLADFTPARVEARLVAGGLRLAQGDLAGARELLGTADATGAPSGLRTDAVIRLALAGGDPATAAEVAHAQLARVRAQGLWAPVSRCLPAMIRALVAVDDLTTADELVGRAGAELAGRDAPLAPAALAHAAGTVAAARRQWPQAVARLRTAADHYERLGCPYEAARAREDTGACLAAAGDPDAAAGPLHTAIATYQRLGARGDLDRVTGLARRHGITAPARHRAGRRAY